MSIIVDLVLLVSLNVVVLGNQTGIPICVLNIIVNFDA